MKRRILLSVMMMCVTLTIFSFLLPVNGAVTEDQIIVAEPLPRTVLSENGVYLNVNTTSKNIIHSPLGVVVVQQHNVIPFAKQLSGVDNSIMYLSPIRANETDFQASYASDRYVLSEGYVEEVKVINKVLSLRKEMAKRRDLLAKLPAFSQYTEAQIESLKLEEKEKYALWLSVSEELKKLQNELNSVRTVYNRYFETVILRMEMNSPNLYAELGNLSVGTYKVRFIKEDGKLLKEHVFHVLEKNIEKPSLTLINTLNKN